MADLTTLARVKQVDNASSYSCAEDAEIEDIIDAVSAWIRRYTNRTIDQTTHDHLIQIKQGMVILPEYPIISISRLAASQEIALRIKNTDSDNERAYVTFDGTGVNLNSVDESTLSTTSTTYSGNATIDDAVTTINAVTDWSAEAVGGYDDWDFEEIRPPLGRYNQTGTYFAGPKDARLKWSEWHVWNSHLEDFSVEPGSGIIVVNALPTISLKNYSGTIRATYSAGYATIPEDIQDAAAQWVSMLWQQSNVDQNVNSTVTGSSGDAQTNEHLLKMPPPRILSVFQKYLKRGI